MRCERCGHEAPGEARFCPSCGAPLPTSAATVASGVPAGQPAPPPALAGSLAPEGAAPAGFFGAVGATAPVVPRHRRRERPPMVPLDRFHELDRPPPPPPRPPIDWRRVAIGVVLTIIVLAIAAALLIYFQGQANQLWQQTKCLDLRQSCR